MNRLKEWQIVALLGITIIVYARLFLRDHPSRTKESESLPFEEAVEHFAYEIEEENKKILEHIKHLKSSYDKETAKLNGKVERLEKQVDALQSALASYSLHQQEQREAENPANHGEKKEAPKKEQTSPLSIESRYETILTYYRNGKSIDWIAKKTGVHHGEIQLILKLANQEAAQRA